MKLLLNFSLILVLVSLIGCSTNPVPTDKESFPTSFSTYDLRFPTVIPQVSWNILTVKFGAGLSELQKMRIREEVATTFQIKTIIRTDCADVESWEVVYDRDTPIDPTRTAIGHTQNGDDQPERNIKGIVKSTYGLVPDCTRF